MGQDSSMTTVTRVERFLAHLDGLSGGMEPKFWPVESSHSGHHRLTAIGYHNVPEEGLLTGFTYGLSLARQEAWSHGRPELSICVRSEDPKWILAIAYLADSLLHDCPFSYGHTINFGEPIADEPIADAPPEGDGAHASAPGREWLAQLEAMIQREGADTIAAFIGASSAGSRAGSSPGFSDGGSDGPPDVSSGGTSRAQPANSASANVSRPAGITLVTTVRIRTDPADRYPATNAGRAAS